MRCPSHCASHWTWVLPLTWRVRNCLSLRLCECKYCIPNLPNVHLWAPNPNNTVPNSFGISNKTCQVRFWINYWRAWMDKRRQHSLRYLPDFTQQYLSSISVAQNAAEVILISYLCGIFAECAISSDCKPRVWIDIYPSSNAIHYCHARRPSKLYFVKMLLIDRFYSHVFEIFVSEN